MTQRSFNSLSPAEVISLAASLEEEHTRILGEFARHLEAEHPAAAANFRHMQQEEIEHFELLMKMQQRYAGNAIPLVRRDDIAGFLPRVQIPAPGEKSLSWYEKQMWRMEVETERFYRRAAALSEDPQLRKLLHDLAEVEAEHEKTVWIGDTEHPTGKHSERELFILQIIQPGLVGLMDGSVSTLAPVFAAALATGNPWDAFLVGMAASVGAGISMGIAEGMSDDGALTGRGRPLLRGVISGLMTFLGGVGHALPFLIPDIQLALISAGALTVIELFTISWIRTRYMDMPFWRGTLQVVFGGSVVVATGILIGSAH